MICVVSEEDLLLACIKFRSLSSPQDLLHAVERALNQSSEQWLQRLERKEVRDRLATLTPREFEVLKCVIAGIAEQTNCSDSSWLCGVRIYVRCEWEPLEYKPFCRACGYT
jgi:hypothetical protein